MEYPEFIDLLAERLRALPEVEHVARGEEQGFPMLTVDLSGAVKAKIHPRNAWRAVQTGEPLEHVLGVLLRSIVATNATGGAIAPWSEAAPRITTRLETPALAQQHERLARPWAVTPELWEIVVEDHPTHMRGVLDADAAHWGQPEPALFDHGLAQLRRLAERGPRPRQAGPKLWLMGSGDGYGASRLLLPDWLLSVLPARRAPRGWLCMAPARDVLALTPLVELEDFAQVVAFAAAVRQLGRMAHPWPFAPLILADGVVRPLAGGPVRAA